MKFRVVQYKATQGTQAYPLLCAELAAAAREGGLAVRSLETRWSAAVKAPLSLGGYWKTNRVEKKTIAAALRKPACTLRQRRGGRKGTRGGDGNGQGRGPASVSR